MSLAKKTAQGTIWVSITFGAGKFLIFISSAILARLLSPADFGLVGLAMIAMNYLSILNGMGVGKALIYKQDRLEESANTAFWLSCTVGLILFFTAILISPLVVAFFETPEMHPLMLFLAVSLLIDSVGSIHSSLLDKELAFKRRLIPDLMREFTKGTVAIVLAWLGWGVWSLAWGQVIGNLSSTIAAWLVLSWQPSFSFNPKIAKGLTSYGLHIITNSFVSELGLNADYLFVGKLLGPTALGFYTVAFRIPQLIVSSVMAITDKVTFPAYAQVQNNPQALNRGFLITLRFMSLITFPIGTGLFITAPDLIKVIYTNKWAPAIPTLQLLALFAIAHSIGRSMDSVYKAIGRPDIVTKTTAPRTILLFLALWWGVNQYGILGAALAQLVIAIIIGAVKLFIVHRTLGIKFSAIFREMRTAFLSAVVMLASLELFLQFAPPMSSLVRLIIVSTLGACIYVTTIWIIGKETVLMARKLFGFGPYIPDKGEAVTS